MKTNVIVATAILVFGLVRYANSQSLATPSVALPVPEPATGLLLGLAAGAYGLGRWLTRREIVPAAPFDSRRWIRS